MNKILPESWLLIKRIALAFWDFFRWLLKWSILAGIPIAVLLVGTIVYFEEQNRERWLEVQEKQRHENDVFLENIGADPIDARRRFNNYELKKRLDFLRKNIKDTPSDYRRVEELIKYPDGRKLTRDMQIRLNNELKKIADRANTASMYVIELGGKVDTYDTYALDSTNTHGAEKELRKLLDERPGR